MFVSRLYFRMPEKSRQAEKNHPGGLIRATCAIRPGGICGSFAGLSALNPLVFGVIVAADLAHGILLAKSALQRSRN